MLGDAHVLLYASFIYTSRRKFVDLDKTLVGVTTVLSRLVAPK